MTNLKKSTPETSMNEIAERFMQNGRLSEIDTAALLFNAFRLIRRLENKLLAEVDEKRAIDAERISKVALRQEIETEGMRHIRKAKEVREEEQARNVANDGFMAALDADLIADEASEPVLATEEAMAPQPAPQAVLAPVHTQAPVSATTKAAVALRGLADEPPRHAQPRKGSFRGMDVK